MLVKILTNCTLSIMVWHAAQAQIPLENDTSDIENSVAFDLEGNGVLFASSGDQLIYKIDGEILLNGQSLGYCAQGLEQEYRTQNTLLDCSQNGFDVILDPDNERLPRFIQVDAVTYTIRDANGSQVYDLAEHTTDRLPRSIQDILDGTQ